MQQFHFHVGRKMSALFGFISIQVIVFIMSTVPVIGSNQVLVNGDIKLVCAGSSGVASADSFLITIDSISGSIDDTERSILDNPCSTTPVSCHPFDTTTISSGIWGSGGNTTGEFLWTASVPASVNLASSYHVGFDIANQSSFDFYIASGIWAWKDSAMVPQTCAVVPRMRVTGKVHGFASFTPTPTPTNTPTATSSTPQRVDDGAHLGERWSDFSLATQKVSLKHRGPMSRFQQDPITTTNRLLIAVSIDPSRISQSATNIRLTVFEYHGDGMTLKGLADPTLNAESILRQATPVHTQDIAPEKSLQTIILRPTLQSPIDDQTWIISEVDTTVEIGPDRTPNRMSRFYQAFQPALLRPILLPYLLTQTNPIQNHTSVEVIRRSSQHDPMPRYPRPKSE